MGINITLIMINGSQRMALSQRGYFVFVKRASGSCLPSRQLRKEFLWQHDCATVVFVTL